MAILVVRENRNVTPIATSHKPITINQKSGVPKGNQTTVAFSKLSADETLKGFNIPNQIKIMPKDIRIAGILQYFIHRAMFWSIFINIAKKVLPRNICISTFNYQFNTHVKQKFCFIVFVNINIYDPGK